MTALIRRRSPRHKGVYQRCRADCPTDRCREHRWSFEIELPAGGDGKRRQIAKGGYETARDAADARAEIVARHRDGTLATDRTRTFGQWLPEWLAGKSARGELEPSTHRTYADHITHYLIPQLGHVRLSALRGRDLTRAYAAIVADRNAAIAEATARNVQHAQDAATVNAKRAAKGLRPVAAKRVAVPRPLSAATVARIHAVVSGALKSALRAGLVTRNVASDAELPRVERIKVRPPAPEQLGALLDGLDGDRWYPFVVLAAFSGLRRGELLGLQWSDIDLSTGRVVVARQRTSVAYAVIEKTTKTDAGQDRVVYLDAGTLDVLKTWRRLQASERLAWGPAYHATDYVFTREDGSPVHPDQASKAFRRLSAAAGVPGKLHGMRHFRASALISSGADISAVSKMMGHSSINVTADIYGNLFDRAGHELAERAAAIVPRRPVGHQPAAATSDVYSATRTA